MIAVSSFSRAAACSWESSRFIPPIAVCVTTVSISRYAQRDKIQGMWSNRELTRFPITAVKIVTSHAPKQILQLRSYFDIASSRAVSARLESNKKLGLRILLGLIRASQSQNAKAMLPRRIRINRPVDNPIVIGLILDTKKSIFFVISANSPALDVMEEYFLTSDE
jgi:hypothetical protein